MPIAASRWGRRLGRINSATTSLGINTTSARSPKAKTTATTSQQRDLTPYVSVGLAYCQKSICARMAIIPVSLGPEVGSLTCEWT